MLVIPLILGTAAALRTPSLHVLPPSLADGLIPLALPAAPAVPATALLARALVWPAVLLAFLGRYAAVPAAARMLDGKPASREYLERRFLWTAIYMMASAACLTGAVLLAPLHARSATLTMALVTGLLGAAHSALSLKGWERALLAEILGMAGLASSAPLVICAAGRPLDGRAAGVGVLALCYSLSTLAYVRAYKSGLPDQPIRAAREAGQPAMTRLAAAGCLAAHVLIGLIMLALNAAGWLPALALLAFLPMAARTVWGLTAPPRNLRVLGLREVGVAVAFVALAAAGLLR